MDILLFVIAGLVIAVLINWLATVLPPQRLRPRYRLPLLLVLGAVTFGILPLRFSGISLFLAALFTFVFLLVLVIDLEQRLILNIVILPATVIALVASPFWWLGLARAVAGAILAYAVVLLIYLFAGVFVRLRHHSIRVPFGFGDVKLGGFMGVVTGLPGIITALLAAILLGGVGAVLFLGYEWIVNRRVALGAAIPYGPFFCIAGWVVMILRI